MENYIVINGKKAELTEEQLIKLGIKTEDLKEKYPVVKEQYIRVGTAFYNVGSYCKDKDIMEQRILHETLNRLLWRASVQAGEANNPWGIDNGRHNDRHYTIFYNTLTQRWVIDFACMLRGNAIYFPTAESANDALENIVKPFMAEHPDFVW